MKIKNFLCDHAEGIAIGFGLAIAGLTGTLWGYLIGRYNC